MAIKYYNSTNEIISLPEFIEEVSKKVEFGNESSLLECVNSLFKIANNKSFFVDFLNNLLKGDDCQVNNPYSEQSFLIYDCPSFYIRMTYWPILSDNEKVRASQNDLFSYGYVHDHNFPLLTTNYYGDGYITKLWEYDYESVIGYAGESVDLKFNEQLTLGPGMAMYYEPSKDIHSQYAPVEENSLALNIILKSYKQFDHKQYHFDPDKKVINEVIRGSAAPKFNILDLATYFHDDKTIALLEKIYEGDHVIDARQQALNSLYAITNDINYYKKGFENKNSKIADFSKIRLADIG